MERLAVVVEQLDIEPIIQVHRMLLSFLVGEREYLVHDLPACQHWVFVLVLSLLYEIDLPLEFSWYNLHDSLGDFRIKSLQTPFCVCGTRTLKGSILPCLLLHQFLLTNRWLIEHELIPNLILGEKNLSTNWLSTLEARAQVRISMRLSFLRHFHRQLIACPKEQWESMEYVPIGGFLRVAMSSSVNQLFLSPYRVANNPVLIVVEEQMKLCIECPPALVFVLYSATSFVSFFFYFVFPRITSCFFF